MKQNPHILARWLFSPTFDRSAQDRLMKDMAELVLASVNRTHARFKATPSDLTGVSAEVYSTGQSHDGEPTYLFARAIFERGAWTPTDVTVVVGSKALVEDKAAKVRESLA